MKYLIQYLGKTVHEFHFRWNNYKHNSKSYDCNQPFMQRLLNMNATQVLVTTDSKNISE